MYCSTFNKILVSYYTHNCVVVGRQIDTNKNKQAYGYIQRQRETQRYLLLSIVLLNRGRRADYKVQTNEGMLNTKQYHYPSHGGRLSRSPRPSLIPSVKRSAGTEVKGQTRLELQPFRVICLMHTEVPKTDRGFSIIYRSRVDKQAQREKNLRGWGGTQREAFHGLRAYLNIIIQTFATGTDSFGGFEPRKEAEEEEEGEEEEEVKLRMRITRNRRNYTNNQY